MIVYEKRSSMEKRENTRTRDEKKGMGRRDRAGEDKIRVIGERQSEEKGEGRMDEYENCLAY